MKSLKEMLFSNLLGACLLFYGMASATAGGPTTLTDQQLDRVTAGGAIVVAITDAQAAGALTLTSTTANSVIFPSPSPYPGQPGLAPTGAAADGTSLAVGTNLGLQGEPPPSSTTAVSTAGAASGNLVVNTTINHTVTGAGGVTFQAGWTFVYGAWVGL